MRPRLVDLSCVKAALGESVQVGRFGLRPPAINLGKRGEEKRIGPRTILILGTRAEGYAAWNKVAKFTRKVF